MAEDFGGPRKEFFRMALFEIKKKYFHQGIREHLSEDYFMVGLIMGRAPCISMVFYASLLFVTVSSIVLGFFLNKYKFSTLFFFICNRYISKQNI